MFSLTLEEENEVADKQDAAIDGQKDPESRECNHIDQCDYDPKDDCDELTDPEDSCIAG